MPRHVDHEERRREIVAAAWNLIAADGFEHVTIRRLAAEVGGATGRVTNYFASKDDILLAVMEQLGAAHRSGLARLDEALVDAGSDVDGIVHAIVDSMPLDADRARDWKIWLAFWSRAAISPVIAEQHRKVYAAWRHTLGSALVVAMGRTPSAEALDEASEQLLAFIDGLGIHLLIEPGRARQEAVRHLMRTQFDMALTQLRRAGE